MEVNFVAPEYSTIRNLAGFWPLTPKALDPKSSNSYSLNPQTLPSGGNLPAKKPELYGHWGPNCFKYESLVPSGKTLDPKSDPQHPKNPKSLSPPLRSGPATGRMGGKLEIPVRARSGASPNPGLFLGFPNIRFRLKPSNPKPSNPEPSTLNPKTLNPEPSSAFLPNEPQGGPVPESQSHAAILNCVHPVCKPKPVAAVSYLGILWYLII